jgi:hypothetical protein
MTPMVREERMMASVIEWREKMTAPAVLEP